MCVVDSKLEWVVYDSQQDSLTSAEKQVATGAAALQDQALVNLCHELRTPLTVMTGYLEVLSEDWGAQMPQEAAAIVQRMRLSAVEVVQTVENLLDWVSGLAGDGGMLIESIVTAELVAEVASALELLAQRKGLRLQWELRQAPRAIRADRRALRRILLNLILNGLKFTAQGGVTVRMSISEGCEAPAQLRVDVCDTGIGIAPEEVARIFAPFVQLSQNDTRRYRGLGLGLALVKRDVSSLGGRIEVRSRLGAGSIFRIEIPQAVLA